MVHIRTQEEINKISKSCQIVADTLLMLEGHIQDGIKISKLDNLAEDFIRSQGARPAFKGYMGFPSTLCVSIEDAVVHGIPADIELREGQIVGIDCGAELNGYYGDHAKTFSVGEISDEKRKLMKVTEESLYKGIEQAIPGNYVGDIGFAVQSHAESNGFSVVRELVGHGIGQNLHEEPQVEFVAEYSHPSPNFLFYSAPCEFVRPSTLTFDVRPVTAHDRRRAQVASVLLACAPAPEVSEGSASSPVADPPRASTR